MTNPILSNPKYKASLKAIDEAVMAHHKLLEEIGNEDDTTAPESAFVFGWVLGIGIMGVSEDPEVGQFSDVIVEHSDALNPFTRNGVAQHVYLSCRAETDNFTDRSGD